MSAAPTIIDRQIETIRQLCRENHIARLELFGSAMNGTFDLAHSDIDLLVDFLGQSADAYFSLVRRHGTIGITPT